MGICVYVVKSSNAFLFFSAARSMKTKMAQMLFLVILAISHLCHLWRHKSRRQYIPYPCTHLQSWSQSSTTQVQHYGNGERPEVTDQPTSHPRKNLGKKKQTTDPHSTPVYLQRDCDCMIIVSSVSPFPYYGNIMLHIILIKRPTSDGPIYATDRAETMTFLCDETDNIVT